MDALTRSQVQLLQRARDGNPMWGGSTAIAWLRRDVELLLALRLIERHGDLPYSLTPLGASALDSMGHQPLAPGEWP